MLGHLAELHEGSDETEMLPPVYDPVWDLL